ncbi:DUF1028 domain-containing protein [Acinetobacter sp. IK40]|jgi:uncharacterized Ntn-hydrolase superfamily protein|uniref:DUF1028 domain-containing protein n=1 Tax=Acinetobacter sp. IK40 TaxID=2928897 RepID=UPI002D1E4F2E|nr:DUF1028 domain-containing protein [Acinetobacter sp. IK40]MEB3793084.1 DUF1028 domain-containing protein [Acinetobacter sp. IK40]
MTFSIIARCSETGQFGAAISSSSPAVAARCIRAKAGIGVAASQNVTDPQLASILLEMVKYNISPQNAIDELTKNTDFIDYRQLTLLDAHNAPFAFSGENTLGIYAQHLGTDVVCAGNLLDNINVTRAMLEQFEQSKGALAERLLYALQAGEQAGGEAGDVHSAGLLVVDKLEWPIIDLRVDWSDQPISELIALWQIYEPQVDDYVLRALDPTSAPSYGVPGNE